MNERELRGSWRNGGMEVEVVEVEVEVGWAEMMSPPQEAMRYRYRFFIVT